MRTPNRVFVAKDRATKRKLFIKDYTGEKFKHEILNKRK